MNLFFAMLENEDVPRPDEVEIAISDDGKTVLLVVRDGDDRVTAAFSFAQPVTEQAEGDA